MNNETELKLSPFQKEVLDKIDLIENVPDCEIATTLQDALYWSIDESKRDIMVSWNQEYDKQQVKEMERRQATEEEWSDCLDEIVQVLDEYNLNYSFDTSVLPNDEGISFVECVIPSEKP